MKLILLLCLLLSVQLAQATHLSGGCIQAKAVPGNTLTYEITVNLFLNEYLGASAVAALSSLTLCFGDGTTGEASRVSRVFTPNKQYSIDVYRITHTYAGPGTYILLTALANRSSCENIPAAEGLLFTLSTTFSTNTNALNQTPTVSLPQSGSPVGVNQRAVISLAATDSEGDSLAYGLARPYMSTSVGACDRQTITAYKFPNDLTRQGIFKLNNRTGELIWDAPTREGRYTVALNIDEYRNGILISQTTQELLFIVADLVGTPSNIPAYEPAIEGKIVTAIANPEDADLLLTVFPNPVDDRLQVVIQSSNPATATVRLFDPNGRKLHELNFSRVARQHEQVISLTSLTPGIYVVQADIGGRLVQRKVMKR